MAFDWLYGPPVTSSTHEMRLRGCVITTSTVRDAFEILRQHDNASSIEIDLPGGGKVSPDDLDTLGDWQLQGLRLLSSVGDTGPMLFVNLAIDGQATITFFEAHDEGVALLVASTILADGRPRMQVARQFGRIRAWWPTILLTVMAAACLWFIVDTRPPVALAVILIGVLVLAWWLSRAPQRELNRTTPRRYPGHLVLPMSRAEIRASRANTHRDLRIGLLVAVISGPLGALLTILFTK